MRVLLLTCLIFVSTINLTVAWDIWDLLGALGYDDLDWDSSDSFRPGNRPSRPSYPSYDTPSTPSSSASTASPISSVSSNGTNAKCECGFEGSSGRIYKGSKVKDHKYPWLAHIRSFTNRRAGSFAQCGGSLIDEQHVATAAHCVTDERGSTFSASNVDVYLGRTKAFSESSKPESVSKIWVDPKYNNQDLSNDFAILTLSSPVKFTQTVAPVCLPNSENGLSKLIVSGWGVTNAYSDSSDDLLEVEVDYLTQSECNTIKKNYLLEQNNIPSYMASRIQVDGVPTTHMCAINKKTKGDACSGDSGGPLMYHGSNGRYYLMGVVSGSWTECGQASETAGLYTRTYYYKDTIKSIAPNSCWQDL